MPHNIHVSTYICYICTVIIPVTGFIIITVIILYTSTYSIVLNINICICTDNLTS